VRKMGHRWRRMYNLTGLPGWLRFGYSPGWKGRSPTGMPPTAQWIIQSGQLPQYLSYLKTITHKTTDQPPPIPTVPYTPQLTEEQEKQMLEQQMNALQTQLDAIRRRLEELSKRSD
jgi:hypothetical protein